MKDILDIHTHTIASGHAYNTLYEMAKAASAKGLALFGSSDHAPSLEGASSEIFFCNFEEIPRELFGVRVIMGCELNIMDYEGRIDLQERTLQKIDYAIASIHDLCYRVGTMEENTAATVGAIQNPYVNIIGHPDSGKIPLDYQTVVAAAKKYHKLLEVNDSSLSPNSHRIHARENYITMLTLCKQQGVSVIVNSDAHIEWRVGCHDAAMKLLEELDFPEELVVNTSLDRLAEFLPNLKR